MSKMEMEMEEEAKRKQKRAEGGDSPDPKRSRVVGIDHSEDEEMDGDGGEVEEEDDGIWVPPTEEEESEDPEMDGDGGEVEEEDGIWVPPPPTEEEKAKIALKAEEKRLFQASFSELLIQIYGTDDREAIDCIVERKHAAYYARLSPPKLHCYDDDYEEPKQRILLNVEQETRPFTEFCGTGDLRPNLNLFLLTPWEDEDSTPRNNYGTARTLDMYYKRLFPCYQSVCCRFRLCLWNRVPEVDAQYLSLYSELCGLVKQDDKSWISYSNSTRENRIEYNIKAQGMAKQLNLNRLKECDIKECLKDVFKEGDVIAEHKLKLEYDMFLLDSEFDTGLRRENFKPIEHTSVFDHIVLFCAGAQRSKFDLWMEKMKVLKYTKEQCKKELNALHERKLKEYCGIRIRYVRLKRACAKMLGIISEEPMTS